MVGRVGTGDVDIVLSTLERISIGFLPYISQRELYLSVSPWDL